MRTQGSVVAMVKAANRSALEDDQQFRSLYVNHYRQVYGYFRRRTDIQCAQDGTADTFLVAWRRFDEIPEGEAALPWLYATARRILANQWRSRRRADRLLDKLVVSGTRDEPGPEQAVVPAPHIQAVLDAMARLSAAEHEAIRLAEWEGLSHSEIGVVLGCSAHAVDQRIHRARKRLARDLGLDGVTDLTSRRKGGVS